MDVKLIPANTAVHGMALNDSNTFVSQLNVLEQQHDAKQLSDQDYVNARVVLFKKYMPAALPAESAPQAK